MPATLPIGSEKIKRRLFSVGLIGFLTALSIGVDGHPIFQILAAESLGLGPRAVGIALGLGTLSVPIQIWAARIPLHRARYNMRLFLLSMGVMTLITAGLVAYAEPGSWVAGLALGIAIVAEISVSVLLATAWQPLIAYSLTSTQRQFMLGPASAIRGIVILVATALVGVLDRTGHAVYLAVIGVAALVAAQTMLVLPRPPESVGTVDPVDPVDPVANRSIPKSRSATHPKEETESVGSTSGGVLNIYLMMPAVALARWPLLVTYAAVVLWPDGNLGVLGAALAAGSITASLLWRDPGRHVLTAIRAGSVLGALCTAALIAFDGPVESAGATIALLAIVLIGAAARNVTGTAVMELAHRRIDTTNSVRVMTMIDVIGSTTAQAGLFAAGFLIASSGDRGAIVSGLDVYQLWLIVTATVLVAAAARLRLRPGDFDPAGTDDSDDTDETDATTTA